MKIFTFKAKYHLPPPALFCQSLDIATVEYCARLPDGAKWPRMRKSKLSRVKFKYVQFGYADAKSIMEAEDNRILNKIKEGDHALCCN